MVRMLLLFLVIMSCSNIQLSYAGAIKKAVFAGLSHQAITKVIFPAVLNGKGINQAIAVAKKVGKTKKGRDYLYQLLTVYIVTERGSVWSSNAIAIIVGAGIDDKAFEKKINKDMANFDNHVLTLTGISDGLDKNKKYNCRNEKEIYNENADIPYRKVSSPVKEWDYGAYKELAKNEVRYDALEHDHIPSIQSILSYLEKRDKIKLYRKKDEGKIVTNNATSIEIKQKMHRKGRTFGYKNMSDLYMKDSNNLKLATISDFAYYFKENKKLNQDMVTSFVNVYVRNKFLCLYERI